MIALVATLLVAQAPAADSQAAASPAPVVSPAVEAEAHAIGMILRCPVCQGMPIAESPSDMAQAMMNRTRELLGQGKSRDEVIAYFTERYGEWVLLEPHSSGVNVLLWVLPALVLLAGFFVVRGYGRRETASRLATTAGVGRDAYVDAIRREVDE